MDIYEKAKSIKGMVMIIDNKATAEKSYEGYILDLDEVRKYNSLHHMIDECMSADTFSITVFLDGIEIAKEYNDR